MASICLVIGLLFITCSVALAYDPSPLQDFCVADFNTSVLVNGFVCKDPKLVEADDFFTSGLHVARNTSNALGSQVTQATVEQIPGLNTLGLSMVRLDFAVGGINPPHSHPRGAEILLVLEGTIDVGFVTSSPEHRLITKTIEKGDTFAFPYGLVHFEKNVGHSNAVALVFRSGQNAGVVTTASSTFQSNPPIPADLLAKAFQVDRNTINQMIH